MGAEDTPVHIPHDEVVHLNSTTQLDILLRLAFQHHCGLLGFRDMVLPMAHYMIVLHLTGIQVEVDRCTPPPQ